MRTARKQAEQPVPVSRLRAGMYIRLDLSWHEHPFLFSSFKIKNAEQIDTLRELGVPSVIWVPDRSDVAPAEAEPPSSPDPHARTPPPQQAHDAPPAGRERVAGSTPIPPTSPARSIPDGPRSPAAGTWRDQNARVDRCRERYEKHVSRIRELLYALKKDPERAVRETEEVVQEVVGQLVSEGDYLVYFLNASGEDADVSSHALNVAVLALMLGKEAGLDAASLRLLGLGAVFHDVGRSRLPSQHYTPDAPLTVATREYLRLHTLKGDEVVSRLEAFPQESRRVVREHHEAVDGSGFPDGLVGEQISLFARIVAIADTFDSLTNKPLSMPSLTPYQALAYMYGRRKKQLGETLLPLYVRSMGVYPPGTVVRLSSGVPAIIVSGNAASSLRPNVLLYDPEVPREEATILCLEDRPELTIEKSLLPGELAPDVREYLSPSRRINYYVDATDPS